MFIRFIYRLLNCIFSDHRTYTMKGFEFVDVEPIKENVIRDCVILGSHNSTLFNMQIGGKSGLEALLRSLDYNCRMLELDVYSSPVNDEPVVSHGNKSCQATSAVSLESCLEVISEYGWRYTNLPLFLMMEICTTNTKTIDQIEALINMYFSHKIIQETKTRIENMTLERLKERLVIIPQHQRLRGLKPPKLINVSNKATKKMQFSLSRVYPHNVFLSSNYNWKEFLPYYYNFITMNIWYKDKHLKSCLDFFQYRGIIPYNIINN